MRPGRVVIRLFRERPRVISQHAVWVLFVGARMFVSRTLPGLAWQVATTWSRAEVG
jgi:hypothetical protein